MPQAMGKGNFPGPLPLIASGKIDTMEQAAKVKASGADAVYLSASAGVHADTILFCSLWECPDVTIGMAMFHMLQSNLK
jgi:hypothetical protein